jgi:hypothetical protein
MKTKRDGIVRAFEPYSQQEMDLILSLVPTHVNAKNLAKSLGRTEEAIHTVYHYAYSGKWLKRDLAEMGEHQDNVLTKIAKSKKKHGIFIGHEPK